MKAHLSLSTNWISRSLDGGRGLVDAAHRLGLDALELGYSLTHRQADDIRAAVSAREIAITSVHAFCPVPMGATEGHPEIFSLCATDARERRHGVEAVLDTARFAAETGASAVVLHAGRVPELVHAAKDFEKRLSVPPPAPGLLSRLLRRPPPAPPAGAVPSSPAIDRLREKLVEQRTAKAGRYLDALRAALDELLPAFEDLGLKLGLENLPTYDAIPTEPEMFQLLQEFDSPAFGYWHDLGHGQVRANLGFIHHASVARRLAPHMVGMHVHDVMPPAGDHLMPPRGKTNFRALAFLADLPIPAVLEPAPDTPEEDLRTAIDYLRDVWTRSV